MSCNVCTEKKINLKKTEAKTSSRTRKIYVYCKIFVRFTKFGKKKQKTLQLTGSESCSSVVTSGKYLYFFIVNVIMIPVSHIIWCIELFT